MEFVYGQYSYGSGAILKNRDLVTERIDQDAVISDYIIEIKKNLYKAKISENQLKSFAVMDVGTGRQAIAFNRLGAFRVDHYDYSVQNVDRLKEYINSHSTTDNSLSTIHADLVEYKLGKNQYDLIYLHGIVQHFSDVGRGLLNCLRAAKVGGTVWLYFYRSGTFCMFLLYLIRDLISINKNMETYHLAARLLLSKSTTQNYIIDGLMDNFFVPHAQLFRPEDYINFIKSYGFEVIGSSRIDPISRNIDHKFAYPSSIVICRKKEEINVGGGTLHGTLSVDRQVNQLDLRNYSDPFDAEILESIEQYHQVKNRVKDVPELVMALAFRLNTLLDESFDSFSMDQSFLDGHEKLQYIFNKVMTS